MTIQTNPMTIRSNWKSSPRKSRENPELVARLKAKRVTLAAIEDAKECDFSVETELNRLLSKEKWGDEL